MSILIRSRVCCSEVLGVCLMDAKREAGEGREGAGRNPAPAPSGRERARGKSFEESEAVS